MAQNQNYSEKDIQDILSIAATRQASQSMSSDILRQSAAELGISEEHLAAAEAEHAANTERNQALQAFRARRVQGFYSALIPYVLVNALLMYLSLRNGDYWFLYPLGFWGIAVLGQGWEAFSPNQDEAFKKWQEEQTNKPAAVDITDAINEYKELSGDIELRNRLSAIKYVREQTGMGLKESKEAVDRFSG